DRHTRELQHSVMSNRRQPQRLPPPIMHGAEAIESDVILHEYPDELGLLLWKSVRSIRLWAEVLDGERSATFSSTAHGDRLAALDSEAVPEVLRTSLAKVAAVLQPRARSATVASACRS